MRAGAFSEQKSNVCTSQNDNANCEFWWLRFGWKIPISTARNLNGLELSWPFPHGNTCNAGQSCRGWTADLAGVLPSRAPDKQKAVVSWGNESESDFSQFQHTQRVPFIAPFSTVLGVEGGPV